METGLLGFLIAAIVMGILSLVGLILLVISIIFIIKNNRKRVDKAVLGQDTTANIIGIVGFSMMAFFGGIWFVCFGLGAIGFLCALIGFIFI